MGIIGNRQDQKGKYVCRAFRMSDSKCYFFAEHLKQEDGK